MRRVLSFLDERQGFELILPVTPSGYRWTHGAAVETLAMDRLGDLNLRGGKTLANETLEILLPAQVYSFCNAGAIPDPWHYLSRLKQWSESETPIRFLVSGTPLNVSVLLESVAYREEGGTNDLYVTLILREYQRLDTPQISTPNVPAREATSGASAQQSYTVRKGDTLWGIAARYYGKGNEYQRLASANHIKNANLIYPGQVLTIPARDTLPPPSTPPPSVAFASTVQWDATSVRWC